MIKKALWLFLLLVVSCQDKDKDAVFTPNQEKLKNWYNTAISQRNGKHLVIEKYADSITAHNRNEPTDFKTLGHLAYATYYNSINNDSLSFKNFNTALNLARQTKNDSLLASAYCGLGNYYKHTGDYPKSTKNYLTALKLSEKRKDTMDIAAIYASLGQLELQKDDQKQARKHLSIAKKLLKDHKEKAAYLITLHTLANLNGMNGKYAEALKLDEEGLKICEKIQSPDLKATFLDNKANCFMFSNRLDSAKYYFNECLKLDLMGKNDKQISDSYANLATLAIYYGNDQEVMDLTQKSIAIAQKVNYNPGIAKNYYLLIDYYKSKNDYKNAYEYTNKYLFAYKNLINERKEVAQAEFKAVYESEKKEKELLISKAEIARKNTQFQILVLVSIALLAIAYLIYRQQRLKNRQQEQEFQLKSAIREIETQNKLHEQRLSISRDLHDNIGAQLTFVISSVDNLKFANTINDGKIINQLTKISDFTKSTIIELRDTIWAMNKSEFSFEDFRSRIFNFIEKAKTAKEEVHFAFQVDPQLNDKKFTSLVGINLYRTIQEAVNNAMKYAGAENISVDIAHEKNQIRISIHDDGIGFDPATADLGNGIQNMKKRINDIGGTFVLDSVPGEGTQLTILIG